MQRGKKLIVLADMIIADEDALICDLAETYHIYDYRSLPCTKVAVYACGLRDNSRIKMKMNDVNVSTDTLINAICADWLALLVWMNSQDGAKGVNRPISISQIIQNDEACRQQSENGMETFVSADAFERRRQELIAGRR